MSGTVAGASHPLMAPELEFVFELRVAVGPEQHVGRGPGEELGFTPITGGTVSGPALDGEVVAGGGDWWVYRGDTTQLDARYLLRASDGAVIDVMNRGYHRADEALARRLEAGEPVTEQELYYRTAPVFQTDAPAHRWLAEHQFIGLARPEPGHVCIRVFVVR
ncbi:DUF3237 domain-containing protein [Agromyces lapidis]|uniref:UPF0311 protein ACFFQV_00470 n=1 Tax=Agromyces lapidis TaxID=279574 RepID=A0ABV5SK83_9MICO|nr:DUF3237 domain-containing protein [Agromyces lapidis]